MPQLCLGPGSRKCRGICVIAPPPVLSLAWQPRPLTQQLVGFLSHSDWVLLHKELQTLASAKILWVVGMGRVSRMLGSLRNEEVNLNSTDDGVLLWMGIPLEMDMINTVQWVTLHFRGGANTARIPKGHLGMGLQSWLALRLNPRATPGLRHLHLAPPTS